LVMHKKQLKQKNHDLADTPFYIFFRT